VVTATNPERYRVIEISYPTVFLSPSIRPHNQEFGLRKQGGEEHLDYHPNRGGGMSQSNFDALATGPD
jgi:hypothetical protein